MIFLDIETAANEQADSIIPPDDEFEKGAKNRHDDYMARAALDWATGRVVCVGIIDDDSYNVKAMLVDEEEMMLNFITNQIKHGVAITEESRKDTQWVTNYHIPTDIVTFNGYNFDIPFLRGRCSINGIPWTRPDLVVSSKYRYDHHIDLYQCLTEFENRNRMRWKGGQSLDFFCKLFNIEVKDESGISGKDVPGIWKEIIISTGGAVKQRNQIIQHCEADLVKLKKLYERTEDYFVFQNEKISY